jgi:hypothetical protein
MTRERGERNKHLTRRDFLKSVGAVAAAGTVTSVAGNTSVSASVSSSPTLTPAANPGGFNILMILVDQERFNLNFPSQVELPNHERLRAQGLTFTNYYITTGMCTPSRSVIYTGQHVPHTGMADNTDYPYIRDLSPDIPTIGHMLREMGYYTPIKASGI